MDDAITRAWHRYECYKERGDGKKIGVTRKYFYITRSINSIYVLLQRDKVLRHILYLPVCKAAYRCLTKFFALAFFLQMKMLGCFKYS